jgi:aminobenzoyl-glutamate transport protein
VIRVVSLLSPEGVRYMFTSIVPNFANFAPLGTVLVSLLGVGVAEKSGLLAAATRALVLSTPRRMVTIVVVFAGVLSNAASEMGYVVLVPLGAAIFHALGRHPIAGLAAAFAGVSGGYSANLLIGTIDPLLSGLTQEAARSIDPEIQVHAAVNWYFMIGSTFLITAVGAFVTDKIVEPRLGKYDAADAEDAIRNNAPTLDRLSASEKRALRWAGVWCGLMLALFVWLAGPQPMVKVEAARGTALASIAEAAREGTLTADTVRPDVDFVAPVGSALGPATESAPVALFAVPAVEGAAGSIARALDVLPYYGVLRDPGTGGLLPSPFLSSIVAFIVIFFIVPGFVYGRVNGTMRGEKDVIDAMATAMGSMGLYIVLVFFAAQFVEYFNHSRLGTILAVLGAEGLRAIKLDNPGVFIPFIVLCGAINLVIGSASAKWALIAPIFVPMLMSIGYSPEITQCAYRIGDSCTNIITPMMSYFGLILAFAARYDKKLGLGTLISSMLPYTIFFMISWMAFFYLWVFALDIPIGPGVEVRYTAPMAQ